jgi:hypothetical protein
VGCEALPVWRRPRVGASDDATGTAGAAGRLAAAGQGFQEAGLHVIDADKTTADAAEGERLLAVLDGLPLAIAQASADLQESEVGLAAYSRFYEQQWSKLMESDHLADAPLQDYPDRSVWTMWAISYQAIVYTVTALILAKQLPSLIVTVGADFPTVVLLRICHDHSIAKHTKCDGSTAMSC